MNALSITRVHQGSAEVPFDLTKITRAKAEFGLAPNTVRKMFSKGLPYYQCGRLVLVSKCEVQEFIKSGKAQ